MYFCLSKQNLFEIDRNTGLVRVQQGLDRERAAEVTYTVQARDIRASTLQTGTGWFHFDFIRETVSSRFLKMNFLSFVKTKYDWNKF